jgi:hypothetical protein
MRNDLRLAHHRDQSGWRFLSAPRGPSARVWFDASFARQGRRALSLRDLPDAHAPGDQAFSVMKLQLIKSDRFGLCAVVVFGTLR